MKTVFFASTLFPALLLIVLHCPHSSASTDGVYTLDRTETTWDGTDANRLTAPTTDYDYTYGDESSVTYSLPWIFTFYGLPFNQITADTNGNIWFGFSGSAHSINLVNTGRGPVISAWNDDLSSRYHGGVFIQRKTSPTDRVVIEWQRETYSDEGMSRPANFEVILFKNNLVRVNYKSFDPENPWDFGSGISKDDGTRYLSLTADYGNAHTLEGQSFTFTDPSQVTCLLNLLFTGTGAGMVTSQPPGIACNTNCTAAFPANTVVSLHADPTEYSMFTGWTNGQCLGTGDCGVTMTGDTAITSVFTHDEDHQVSIAGATTSYYTSIQQAYNMSESGNIIRLWSIPYAENLLCDRPIELTLRGGFDAAYTNITGEAVLEGTLTVTDGALIPNGLCIR